MKKIKPFTSVLEAMKSLDNGGRFYNVFTKADDDIITGAELSKVGGLGQTNQKLMLFLQMSISKLHESDREKVISKLSGGLKEKYEKFRAKELSVSEIESKSEISSNVILTGTPKLKESKSEFTGFITVPVMTGNVMSMIMVPIIEEREIYDFTDEKSGDSFIIAHAKGKEKLPEKPVRIGGVLKELKTKKEENSDSKLFLDAAYFTISF